MTSPLYDEFTLHYPAGWETEYRANSLIQQWVAQYPDQFEPWMNEGFRKGSLELFAQYCLMYLIRRELGYCSLTWFKLCSTPWGGRNEERTLRYWAIMRRTMGNDRFELLQRELKECGFRDFKGEPDLFCWHPETFDWFFAEAKAKRDKIQEVQRSWMRVYHSVLAGAPMIRVYHVLAAPAPAL